MSYVAVSERLHVSSTRCDHCWTCRQTILFACQLLLNMIINWLLFDRQTTTGTPTSRNLCVCINFL